jgi:uncharacterized protein (TIGR00255 family)
MRSMTGFGRAEQRRGGIHVVVEVRTLNQRFFELKTNLPRGWGDREAQIRKMVQTQVERGRVEVFVRTVMLKPSRLRLEVNEDLARSYVTELRRLGQRLNLDGKLALDAVLQRPEIFQVTEEEHQPEAGADLAMEALRQAMRLIERERSREGRELRRDFEQRLKLITDALPRIETLAAKARETLTANFTRRMRDLLAEAPVNEKRLYEDALAASHHGDISEEMTRLRVHLKAMGPLLKRAAPAGKSIEFLLQEINREINTIGAKSQDAQMSQIAVEMKGEIEKMREQVQNVE